jgi:hypothetical protein
MKHALFMFTSIVIFTLSTGCMDDDVAAPDEETHIAPLQAIVIEKITTLKEACDAGIRPHKNNTALSCTHQSICFLDDLSTLREQWHLQTLTSLDLSHNRIEKLPKVLFAACPNLIGISLAHNRLKEIGPDLPYHQRLTTLYLHDNNFKGVFPLAYLLQRAPLMWLTLYKNPEITGFGDMPHKYRALEQLSINRTIPEKERIKIARQCPNLKAEMCDSGTEVQTVHSITKYTDKYYATSGNGACWGLSGGLCCFTGVGVAASLGHPAGVMVASGVAAATVGITIGPVIGWQIAIRYFLKPEEKYTTIPIDTIAARPSMLAYREEDESSSDSDSLV